MPSKILTYIRNSGSRINPLNFPALIGDLAQSLLLYDEIIIVTESYIEVTGIVTWMGEEAFIQLLKNHSISFLLAPFDFTVPTIPGSEHILTVGEIRILSQDLYSAFDLEQERNKIGLIQDQIQKNPFLPKNFSLSPETVILIAQSTKVADSTEIRKGILQDSMRVLDHLITNRSIQAQSVPTERPFLLGSVLQKVGSEFHILPTNEEERNYASNHLTNDFLTICYHLKMAALSREFQVNLIDGTTLAETLLPGYFLLEDPDKKSKIFTNLISIHDFPQVHQGVYLLQIEAASILSLRNSSSGGLFRNWMSSMTAETAAVKQFIKDIELQLPTQSLGHSTYRYLIATGFGLLDTGVGLFFGLVDFLISNIYPKSIWKPNVFICDKYGSLNFPHLSEEPMIPIDLLMLIAAGYVIQSFRFDVSETKVSMVKSNGKDSFNVTYGDSSEEKAYLRYALPEIIARSDKSEFLFRCSNCQILNRLTSHGIKISDIRCSSCKNIIFNTSIDK